MLTHKTPYTGVQISSAQWNEEHLFSGGVTGAVLVRDTTQTTGASWTQSPQLVGLGIGMALEGGYAASIAGNVHVVGDVSGDSLTVLGTFSAAAGLVVVAGSMIVPDLDVQGALTVEAGATFLIAASGNTTFAAASVSDHGAVGNFNFCVGYASNAGDANRGDHVFTLGYNTKPSGGRAVTSEPAFELRMEDYYKPATTAFVEAHFQYYDPAGNGFRPWAMQIDRSVNGYLTNATVNVTATGFSYLGINGTQYFQFKQQQLQVINGSLVTMEQNNYYWGKQLNAAGSAYIELPYINASDQLVLGGQSVTGVKALSNAIASAASGKRYVVIDTAGLITSQASAPVGT